MKIAPAVRREITAALSRAPKKLKGVHFIPWVGKDYAADGFRGKRIMALGESHYVAKEMVPNQAHWTCQCVAEQVATDYRFRFWSGIAKSFLGEIPDLAQRRAFWHSIAFYNYVQEIVGDKPRDRPTPAMLISV